MNNKMLLVISGHPRASAIIGLLNWHYFVFSTRCYCENSCGREKENVDEFFHRSLLFRFRLYLLLYWLQS